MDIEEHPEDSSGHTPTLPRPLEELRRIAAAVADARRCRLLLELSRGPQAVRDLVERTGLRQPLVSHHLAVLRRAGLVRDTREGRLRKYRLAENASGVTRVLIDLVLAATNQKATPGPSRSVPASGIRQTADSPKLGSREPATPGSVRRPPKMEDYLL